MLGLNITETAAVQCPFHWAGVTKLVA